MCQQFSVLLRFFWTVGKYEQLWIGMRAHCPVKQFTVLKKWCISYMYFLIHLKFILVYGIRQTDSLPTTSHWLICQAQFFVFFLNYLYLLYWFLRLKKIIKQIFICACIYFWAFYSISLIINFFTGFNLFKNLAEKPF